MNPKDEQPATGGSDFGDLKLEIGGRIADLRGEEDQKAFAARLGVHWQTLGRYERGERLPDTDFVLSLMRVRGISADWLFNGGTDIPGERGHLAIGSRLRQAREEFGLTVQQMADRSHIRLDLYESYEAGAMPGASSLAGLSLAGVNIGWLLTGLGGGPVAREETGEYGGAYAMLPLYDIRAEQGRQRLLGNRPAAARRAYSREWLVQHVRVFEERLALVTVAGDALEPDLHDGDEVMIDRGDREELRAGIYVFCLEGQMHMMRLSLRPAGLFMGRLASPGDYALAELQRNESFRVIGRVIGQPMFRRL